MMAASLRKSGSTVGKPSSSANIKRPPLNKKPSGFEANLGFKPSQDILNHIQVKSRSMSQSHGGQNEEDPKVKKRNPREVLFEEIKSFLQKPSQKKQKELQEKC